MSYILAIDQATAENGYAALDIFTEDLIEYGFWDNSKIGDTQDLGHTTKRANTKKQIELLIKKYPNKIIIVACEGVFYNYKNPDAFKKLSKVQGSIQDLCYELEIPCHAFDAGTWHSYLGIKGNRDAIKKATKEYVLKKYPQLETDMKQDVYDAIAIGLGWIEMNRQKNIIKESADYSART